MRVRIVIIAIVLAHAAAAQNLVPNPSFEKFFKCPWSWNTDSRAFNLPGWTSATDGTPDHYHTCSTSDCSVPVNWAGTANPHSGDGYAGVYVWGKNGKSYREYIECELTEPLKAGQDYRIGFFYKLSSNSKYKTDRIGLLLIDSVLRLGRNKVFRVPPTLSVIHTPAEQGDWDEAYMIYRAKGGESHLVIGNFFDDHNTENIRLDYRSSKNAMMTSIAYYYIDDVSVSPVDSLVKQPAMPLAAVNETKTNEIYALKNIQFEFNSYELIPTWFSELDKLVIIMRENPHWNVELVGHTDDVGPESYNVGLSRNRAVNVCEYLVSKGIALTRITTSGAGESMLLANGTDEMSRTINRRVEVQFVERQLEK